MLIKSLIETKVETAQGKRDIKAGEVFEVRETVFNSLKTMYKNSFEFLPLYVLPKKDIVINGKVFEEGEITEVDYKKFKHLYNLNRYSFIFINTAKLYEEYIGKLNKKRGRPKKEENSELEEKTSQINTSNNEEIEKNDITIAD